MKEPTILTLELDQVDYLEDDPYLQELEVLQLPHSQVDYLLEVLQLPHSEDDPYLQEIVHSIHKQVYL